MLYKNINIDKTLDNICYIKILILIKMLIIQESVTHNKNKKSNILKTKKL